MTCAFNSDGSMIAVGNRNGQTFFFDVARAKLGLRFFGPRFHEVAFHPTKRLIAIALADGRIWLKTTENLDAPFSSPVAGGDLRNLDWSPNGQLLATGGRNSKIILWDSEKLTILQQLDAPEWVSSVCFTPDGTQLLVAGGTEMPSADRAVTVWGVP